MCYKIKSNSKIRFSTFDLSKYQTFIRTYYFFTTYFKELIIFLRPFRYNAETQNYEETCAEMCIDDSTPVYEDYRSALNSYKPNGDCPEHRVYAAQPPPYNGEIVFICPNPDPQYRSYPRY